MYVIVGVTNSTNGGELRTQGLFLQFSVLSDSAQQLITLREGGGWGILHDPPSCVQSSQTLTCSKPPQPAESSCAEHSAGHGIVQPDSLLTEPNDA
jgi:hypothetical protein